MFELAKQCIEYENITTVERLKILIEKSDYVLSEFGKLNVSSIDPENTLVAFIIGAVVSEDVIDEKEYLMIYPALVKSFGYDFDFAAIKKTFYEETDIKKLIGKNRKRFNVIDVYGERTNQIGYNILMFADSFREWASFV